MVRYHLALDGKGANGGKRVRPLLGLLAYASIAGDHRKALPGAAAVELGHNFSLVHDDIEDGDTERRHHPRCPMTPGTVAAEIRGRAFEFGDWETLGRSEGAIKSLYHRTLLSRARKRSKTRHSEVGLAKGGRHIMEIVTIIFRILHIFSAVAWVGAAWLVVLFIEPTVRAMERMVASS